MMWSNEGEYMKSWVWPSSDGKWYLRVSGQTYDTYEEAVEAMRKRDREAGIVWPWQEGQG